jgi:demethoxyubiquinone hydroxylase (CLK1/Coq7/Cat5 family)
MVEFGGVKNKPIVLTQPQVHFLAGVIPHVCEFLCNESKSFKDGTLRLATTGAVKVARLYQGKSYIAFKLEELRYIQDMFYIVQNQQVLYIHAMPDVLTYVTCSEFNYLL